MNEIPPQKCRLSYKALLLGILWCLFTVFHYIHVHNTYLLGHGYGGHQEAFQHEKSEEELNWLMLSGLNSFDSIQYQRGKKMAQKSSGSISNSTSRYVQPRRDPSMELEKEQNMELNEGQGLFERPKLILHIGPPKMGTTTLQHYLEKDDNDGILALSNYTYIKCPNLQKMYAPITGANFTNWEKFQSCLDEAKAKGPHMNAVYSQEVFGKFFSNDKIHWRYLRKVTSDWQVIIVVSYRRFFEWLPSYYYQNNRLMNCMGPCQPPTFHEYFETMKVDTNSYFATFWGGVLGERHPTEALIEKFGAYFDVVVHNIHEEPENLVANFYCNIMHAEASCSHRRSEGLEVSKNVGSTLNYNLLAIAAKNAHLVPKKVSRFILSKAIQHFQESQGKNENDFPLTCINDVDQYWLLTTSLEFEKRLIPKWFESERGEMDHREKFSAAIEKNKFCNLNADQAILDPKWNSFFTEFVGTEQSGNKKYLLNLTVGDTVEYLANDDSDEWVYAIVAEKEWVGSTQYIKLKDENGHVETVHVEPIKLDSTSNRMRIPDTFAE